MAILDILYPRRCLGCDDYVGSNEVGGACAACRHSIHDVVSPLCPRCALPRDVQAGVDMLCGSCLSQPPSFDRAFAKWIYDGAIADAIRRAKTHEDPARFAALAEPAVPWFGDVVGTVGEATWFGVPTHPADLRRRGFDHVRLLLRRLASGAGCPLTLGNGLRKVIRTPKQALLRQHERTVAQQAAFSMQQGVTGRAVLFDDVMTTGATLNQAGRTLKRAGATEVVVVVLARAM